MHEVSKMKDKQFVFNDFKISNFGEELLSSFSFSIFGNFVNKAIFFDFLQRFFPDVFKCILEN